MTVDRHDLQRAALDNWHTHRGMSNDELAEIGYSTPETLETDIATTLARQRETTQPVVNTAPIETTRVAEQPELSGLSVSATLESARTHAASRRNNSRKTSVTGQRRAKKGTGIDRRKLSPRGKLLADQAPAHERHDPYS